MFVIHISMLYLLELSSHTHCIGAMDLDTKGLEDFLREATFLSHDSHVNLLETIGVVWRTGDRPSVILPYMEKGDLLTLVKKEDLVSCLCCHIPSLDCSC